MPISFPKDPQALTNRRNKLSGAEIIKAITEQDLDRLSKSLYNDLEKVVLPAHSQVAKLRHTLETLSSGGGNNVGFRIDAIGCPRENLIA